MIVYHVFTNRNLMNFRFVMWINLIVSCGEGNIYFINVDRCNVPNIKVTSKSTFSFYSFYAMFN